MNPTVRPPEDELCDCGRIAIAGHRCQFCSLYRADPIEQVLALHLAAASAEDELTPPQRIEVRRRLIAAERERLATRLARGPALPPR